MMFARCPECKEYAFLPHNCSPIWECAIEDKGELYWQPIRAWSSDTAAEKYAEYYDHKSAEYSIVSGRETPIICVRKGGADEIERFAVHGESVPRYYATFVPPQPKE